MSHKLWIDMDGVMADWHRSICDLFNVPYPENHIFHWNWICEQSGRTDQQVTEAMDNHPGFWEDIVPFDHMPRLLTYLDTTFPDWGILTKATRNPQSWSGKVNWVKRYLGDSGLSRLVIVKGRKDAVAGPYSVLVDDSDMNIKQWQQAGGIAFRWREYSTDQVQAYDEQVTDLIRVLNPYRPVLKVRRHD